MLILSVVPDLKSANVLLASTAPDAPVVAKVADFGLSSELVLPNLKGTV